MPKKGYQEWLEDKNHSIEHPACPHLGHMAEHLFDYQIALVEWALRRGRAAIFADTGLGKTVMMVEWARHVSSAGRVLMLAPLAVADQTVAEAERFDVDIKYRREDDGSNIIITNYEMISHFDPSDFIGIVLDESSIIKSFTGSFRNEIIRRYKDTPFKLACTATPAPNDFAELGNHSEFLGVKRRQEMLAEFFCHDGGNTQSWRLKRHAVDIFWQWVCSWGAMLKKPSDLGYDDSAHDLPELTHVEHLIRVSHKEAHAAGLLFAESAISLTEQRAVRRSTMHQRVDAIAELVKHDEPVLIWCDLNAESDALAAKIPGSRQVRGADKREVKKDNLLGFSRGDFRVLITKPKIAGFGMNWQHCNQIVFIGPSHSYEQTYQAIRRCWRFGQKRPVSVHTIVAETEQAIVENYKRKTTDAEIMSTRMVAAMRETMRANVEAARHELNDYLPTQTMEIPSWMK